MSGTRYATAQNWEKRWKRIADDGEAESLGDRCVQVALSAAAAPYALGSWTHRKLFDWGVAKSWRVEKPVVCVGNLSLGGTGKTPVVAWLANRLLASGYRPVVLSRGYGGRLSSSTERQGVVVSDGHEVLVEAEEAGDEPVELARMLSRVPVVAGRHRAAAAEVAQERFDPDVFILDDGFQHYALRRDCDVVVIDASRLPRSLRRFPRGSLREGLGALGRAHAVILTRCDLAEPETLRPFLGRLRKRFPHLAVAPSWMEAEGLATPEGDLALRKPVVQGKRGFLFCGVGHPESVEHAVRSLEIEIVESQILEDHAVVSPEVFQRFQETAREKGADFLLCTRKDAVKIPETLRRESIVPLLVVTTRLRFHPPITETRLLEQIRRKTRLGIPEAGVATPPPESEG